MSEVIIAPRDSAMQEITHYCIGSRHKRRVITIQLKPERIELKIFPGQCLYGYAGAVEA